MKLEMEGFQMSINNILIVDGTSTAANYAPFFRAYGIRCIHLFSDPSIAYHFGAALNQQDYEACHIHQDDIKGTIELLSQWQFSAILHGMDSALELVDTLSRAMNLTYINEFDLSMARRHKFEMIETAKKAGLLTPDQIISDDIKIITDWAEKRGEYPVIIKPVESAGVKGVFKCNTVNEVYRAFDEVMSSSSYYEVPNSTVLIQSYSSGQEYIIDSVSLKGRHYLTSIWAVTRDKGESPFLDYMETVDHGLPEYSAIRDYASKVLDSLGVCNGPTHLEIILTGNGPTLVELNCRLHGSLDLRLTTYACGRNHVQDVVTSLLTPDYFEVSRSGKSSFYGQAMHVLLRSPFFGRKLHKDFWKKLERLPSFVSYKQNLSIGELTKVTKDLKTAVGTLSLFNRDRKQLIEDLLIVRDDEKNGAMYE